ncbi:MAG: ABC transporter ATP-binding protein [Thermoprotei archaeon]
MQTLEAVNLSKKYGTFLALSDLNLKIEGAKCVGFLGPNGAGKTTTLKIFTTMLKPSSGSALINGTNVSEDKIKALESCGVLVETPEIYPALTVREGISMVAEIKGVPKSERSRAVEEAVDEVRMSEWIDRKVGTLSKGMKQRVNLASTLVGNPQVLLLDEPTSGLDPRGMAEVREIVGSLKRKGRLVFMSSHLLSEVSEVCDDVALVNHGKLLMYDKVSNIMGMSSKGPQVVDVTFAAPLRLPDDVETVKTLKNVGSVTAINGTKLRIECLNGAEGRRNLLKELVNSDLDVLEFKSSVSALEEVYMNLIGDVT